MPHAIDAEAQAIGPNTAQWVAQGNAARLAEYRGNLIDFNASELQFQDPMLG